MNSIIDYGLREAYSSIKSMDRLAQIDPMIDWESLRPIVKDLYRNDTEKGGRPNIDEIVMIRTLFLQSMYNCSDDIMEKEIHDRISFRNFLHYPETIPDSRTIWLFRERLSSTGKDSVIWESVWKDLEDHGITVREGTIQDATFIETDPGRHGKRRPPASIDPESMKTGKDALNTDVKNDDASSASTAKTITETTAEPETTKTKGKRMMRDGRKYSRTRRSKDGTWTKKNNASHFGNKLHTLQGTHIPLIRRFVATTASLHDSQIDLSMPDVICYRDKGYAGARCNGLDGTMDKASRDHPLSIDRVRRNMRITRKRSPGERPYSIIKRIMNGGHTFVTMIRRYRVKAMFMCLGYNALTMITLKKQGKIA